MAILRRVLAMRRQGAENATPDGKLLPAEERPGQAVVPADPSIESTAVPEVSPSLSEATGDALLQAGCTAVVAVFQVEHPLRVAGCTLWPRESSPACLKCRNTLQVGLDAQDRPRFCSACEQDVG